MWSWVQFLALRKESRGGGRWRIRKEGNRSNSDVHLEIILMEKKKKPTLKIQVTDAKYSVSGISTMTCKIVHYTVLWGEQS